MAKKGIDINRAVYIVTGCALVLLIAYFAASFFYYPKCESKECFNNALQTCEKSGFLNVKEDSTWLYTIKGISEEKCRINVKAVSLKSDIVTGSALQGKDMDCAIPQNLLGSFMPEEKIEYCHGILKEEIQGLMIENMHLYIVQNIGQINQSTFGEV